MALISFSNVSKSYSLNLILDHVSFNINKGEKVALLGSNGAGKTTIFKLILKDEEPTLMPKEDKPGEISILSNTKIGYLNQNAIANINNSVFDELKNVFKETYKELERFEHLTNELSVKNDKETLEEYNQFLEYLNSKNAFSIENKIKGYLSKFHFPNEYLDKKISTLSGGERMKIAFIKLLLEEHDVLLLDEPTNHLDISTIEWLEEYLKSYKGTVLFISHDRYFIESLATKILDLEQNKVTTYNLKYEDYLKEKEIRYQNMLAKFEKEEEEIARLTKFIEFYRYKPRFVGRYKDRVHKLERIEEKHGAKPTKENREINFKLDGFNLKKKGLLEFINVSAGYNKPLFNEFSFTLYGKNRLAIVGDNGIGKTTLVKTIIGDIPLIQGEIKHLRELNIGYIRQNDYDFKNCATVLDYLRTKYPSKLDSELRTALGTFLFKKDEVFNNIETLSHGEKMRLVLCDLSLSSYEVLILDEPTNHLDLVTKECLLNALRNYKGAIIFISHDRYFINELADYVLYIDKNCTLINEGGYDEIKPLIDELNVKIEEAKPVKKVEENVKISAKPQYSNNKLNQFRKRIAEIEARLEQIEIELSQEFEDYEEINKLNEEKENLEIEYLEIYQILSSTDY